MLAEKRNNTIKVVVFLMGGLCMWINTYQERHCSVKVDKDGTIYAKKKNDQ